MAFPDVIVSLGSYAGTKLILDASGASEFLGRIVSLASVWCGCDVEKALVAGEIGKWGLPALAPAFLGIIRLKKKDFLAMFGVSRVEDLDEDQLEMVADDLDGAFVGGEKTVPKGRELGIRRRGRTCTRGKAGMEVKSEEQKRGRNDRGGKPHSSTQRYISPHDHLAIGESEDEREYHLPS